MKKILAMLLTGVMIIGTLSGCGDGTTEVATAGDSNVSAQATDNASDEGTAAGAATWRMRTGSTSSWQVRRVWMFPTMAWYIPSI